MVDGARARTGRGPSMADVAAAAGVSHQTVSRVLNGAERVREDTRLRVLAAIDELGYRRNKAARLLVTNRSGRIGLIVANLGLYGPSTLAVSVQEAGLDAGYDVSLVGVRDLSADALRAAVERLLDEAVEAIVVAVTHRSTLDRALALELPVPLVLAQGVTSGQPMAAGIDQVAGGVLATEHLLDLGHLHIAHVSGPLDWIEAERRRAGWRLAHERRGLLPGPEVAGDWSARSGYDAGLRIAQDPQVTAVFVANDAMAIGVLRGLHQSGRRCPEEVSVVGFDDIPEDEFLWPALTSVTQPFDQLGRRIVDLTVRALRGEPAAGAEFIRPVLEVRESTTHVP